jgi:hypothetical protein
MMSPRHVMCVRTPRSSLRPRCRKGNWPSPDKIEAPVMHTLGAHGSPLSAALRLLATKLQSGHPDLNMRDWSQPRRTHPGIPPDPDESEPVSQAAPNT